MAFKIFGRQGNSAELSKETEDYVEVDTLVSETGSFGGRTGISVEKLGNFEDTEKVLRALRQGNIVFLKIKELKDRDMGELKRAVEKLKKTAVANNGDIAGVEQDWLIITPSSANVVRGY
jgi:SepF-like predicted cell division protein (DUF552 family)